jgi:hypothetical protein
LTYLQRQKSYGLDKLRWEEAEEAEEKIRLKQYVSLRSKGRHNNTLCVCYNSNFNADIIGDVMVSMFASSVVDCGFKPCPCHTTDNKICISSFCSKHAALIRIMCLRGSCMLLEWASIIKIHLSIVGLVQNIASSCHDIWENCSFGIKTTITCSNFQLAYKII